MTIRKFRVSDSVPVVGLLGQLGYPSTSQAFQRRLKNLDAGNDSILVAVEDHRVVGFVSLHLIPMVHEDGFLARITVLVVEEDFRGQGVGKRLLRAAEVYARRRGAVKAEITSNETRKGAHRFYSGMGYREYRKRFLKRF